MWLVRKLNAVKVVEGYIIKEKVCKNEVEVEDLRSRWIDITVVFIPDVEKTLPQRQPW